MTGPLHLTPAAQEAADRLAQARRDMRHGHHTRTRTPAAAAAATDQVAGEPPVRHRSGGQLGAALLGHLLRDGPLTTADLAGRVDRTQDRTHAALRRLKARGLVTRTRGGRHTTWAAT